MYFYQQNFSGPGLAFRLDKFATMSEMKPPTDDVAIDIVVVSKPVQFISGLRVRFSLLYRFASSR